MLPDVLQLQNVDVESAHDCFPQIAQCIVQLCHH
jgi:hypothetical protein